MNNMPYDNINDLIKGLQMLIEKLNTYRQQNHSISLSLPTNADSRVKEAVQQIESRITFLQERAHDGLEKIQQTLKSREQRKNDIESYIVLLNQMESWLTSTSIHLNEINSNMSNDDLKGMLKTNEECLEELRKKELHITELYEKTEEYMPYSDVSEKTKELRNSLGVLRRTIKEKALIVERNVLILKNMLEPAGKSDFEMQTSPPQSIMIPEARQSFPDQHVEFSQTTQTTRSTDNILIIQSVSNGQETVQISNVPNASCFDKSTDVIVEAVYTQPLPGEIEKSATLSLRNIPAQFETTFTEPDESTMQISVDKDGSKKIILTKSIQHSESIPPDEFIQSTIVATLDQEVQSVSIEKDPERPVSETENIPMKDDKKIEPFESEHSVHALSQDPEAQIIIEGVLKQLQDDVLSLDRDANNENSQVFESVAPIVDLVASVVDTPDSTVISEQKAVDEPSNFINISSSTTAKHSGVTDVCDIWPNILPTETMDLRTSSKPDQIYQTSQESEKIPASEPIWPTNNEIGSDYIEITPLIQVPTTFDETQSDLINIEATVQPTIELDYNTEAQKITYMEDMIKVSVRQIEQASQEDSPKHIVISETSIEDKDKIEFIDQPNVGPATEYKSDIELDEPVNQPLEVTYSGMPDETEQIDHTGEECCPVDLPMEGTDSDSKLELHVMSASDLHGSLKLSLNVDPVEMKKISISLVERILDTQKDDASNEPVIEDIMQAVSNVEKIPGLSDIDVDVGYEADKTTVEDEMDTADTQSKVKRKKKRKPVKENSRAVNTDAADSIENKKEEELKLANILSEEDPVDESVQINEEDVYDENVEVKIIQQNILEDEELTIVTENIIYPTEVIEAIYVEDVQQQTSPVQIDEADAEIAQITSQKLMIPIDIDQKSMQTSPEPEIQKTSHQTSPIVVPQDQYEAKEIQTEVDVLEIETQTPSAVQTEQEIQTENQDTIDHEVVKQPKLQLVENGNQTSVIDKRETAIQTMDDVEQIVDPILTNILQTAVVEGIVCSRKSVQTSPISFDERIAESPILEKELQSACIQTVDAQVQDAQIETDVKSSVCIQLADVEVQTSPLHIATAKECSSENSEVKSLDSLIKMDTDSQTNQIITSETQSQTAAVTFTEPIDTIAHSTQTTTAVYSEKDEKLDKPSKRTKKMAKKTKASGMMIPVEIEVQTKLIMEDSHIEIEPTTVTKTVTTESSGESQEVEIHIQMDVDSSSLCDGYPLKVDYVPKNIWSIGLTHYLTSIKRHFNSLPVPWDDLKEVLSKKCSPDLSELPPVIDLDKLSENIDDQQTVELDALIQELCFKQNDHQLQERITLDIIELLSRIIDQEKVVLDNYSHLEPCKRLLLVEKYIQMTKMLLTQIQKSTSIITNSKLARKDDILYCLEHLAANIEAKEKRFLDLKQLENDVSVQIPCIIQESNELFSQLNTIDKRLENLSTNDTVDLIEKHAMLDELDQLNLAISNQIARVSDEYQQIKLKPVECSLDKQLSNLAQVSNKIVHGIILERNRLQQLSSLSEEYQQTLIDFKDITTAAEDFIVHDVVTNSLEELQDEMQRYRKFFVNLNHCKMVLETLETNLDLATRNRYVELHSNLYSKTTSILEQAVERAAKLAQAASKWTILEKDMRNEIEWLRVAQQRIPKLEDVSSEDFEQYIALYQSLNQDILRHHAKMVQNYETSRNLQALIKAPTLEKESNGALGTIIQLKEEVSLNLNVLLKFQTYWARYNRDVDKLGDWMFLAQRTLTEIDTLSYETDSSVENVRKFWEMKAQYEVLNSKIYTNACDSFDQAFSTLSISDEQLQRQLHGQLLENWLKISSSISDIQEKLYKNAENDSIPSHDRTNFIKQELTDVHTILNGPKIVLKCREELYTYIEKIHLLRTRIHLIDSEVGQVALTTDCNTEKVSEMFEKSRDLLLQVNEEHESAEVFYRKLIDIENGIREQEKRFQDVAGRLEKNSISISGKMVDVEQSLDDCIICQNDLIDSWNELMRLRQMLHTLPMNLKVSVSPLQTERDLSVLQNIHNELEKKCEHSIIALRNRLHLWKKFNNQIELIQEHISETEFMMELLQVQENADFARLLKATERLDILLEEVERRKTSIVDLRSAADPLIETSIEDVALEIQQNVQNITLAWDKTREDLKNLCERYEKAVQLWKRYHVTSETIKSWVNADFTKNEELCKQINLVHLVEYQKSTITQKESLEKLKDVIKDLNENIGFNIGNSLL
ncbi:muscle-specific protein 300 kDa-like, partial [Uranotaenia lowii]|uniref:muscle-specific protein 300 kDa-like n=1 Tax=Uranotaenia lowii TaxID=190385 RepID=UPI00247A5873